MKKWRGRFKPGPDPRRHLFTPEECRRGGQTRWRQIRAIWRQAMRLTMPGYATPEYLEDLAARGIQGG